MPQPTPHFTNFSFCDVMFLLSTEPRQNQEVGYLTNSPLYGRGVLQAEYSVDKIKR